MTAEGAVTPEERLTICLQAAFDEYVSALGEDAESRERRLDRVRFVVGKAASQIWEIDWLVRNGDDRP